MGVGLSLLGYELLGKYVCGNILLRELCDVALTQSFGEDNYNLDKVIHHQIFLKTPIETS
jgi:hypothetical protein